MILKELKRSPTACSLLAPWSERFQILSQRTVKILETGPLLGICGVCRWLRGERHFVSFSTRLLAPWGSFNNKSLSYERRCVWEEILPHWAGIIQGSRQTNLHWPNQSETWLLCMRVLETEFKWQSHQIWDLHFNNTVLKKHLLYNLKEKHQLFLI